MPLALTEVIAQLRTELAEAMRAGEDEELRFELGPVELELTVGVDKEAKPGAKAKFWVLEMGTEARFTATSTQRIKLTLDPRHTAAPGRRPTISGDAAPHER
jgi:NTP-dependent ternary system trypsin peptidase co-occuring protein